MTHQATGKSLSFGALAADAAKADPGSVSPKDRKDWTILGKAQKRPDILAKITGQPVYGIDVSLPDMIYGTVIMAPAFGAKAKGVKDEAARAVKGVIDIVPLDTLTGNGYGVLATNTWAAFKGRSLLEIDWSASTESFDSSTIDAPSRPVWIRRIISRCAMMATWTSHLPMQRRTACWKLTIRCHSLPTQPWSR